MSGSEAERLRALHRYQVMDTNPERAFDDLTLLASTICGTPVALITLLDDQRQWFKSKVGIDLTETSREISFCTHAIHSSETMIVEDSKLDPRFQDNPFVTGEPSVRFYAGTPLETPNRQLIGTLCVLDHKPRTLTAVQTQALEALARQVVGQLELRLALIEQEVREKGRLFDRFRAMLDQAPFAIQSFSIDGTMNYANQAWTRLWDVSDEVLHHQILGKYNIFADTLLDQLGHGPLIREAFQGKQVITPAGLYRPRRQGSEGRDRWVVAHFSPLKDENNQLTGVILMSDDVTDRKVAEDAARATLKMLQSIIDNSPATIYVKDPDGRYLMINREFERILRRKRQDIVGKTDADFMPAEHAERYRDADIQAMMSLEPYLLEESVLLADGETHTYLSAKFPMIDASGRWVASRLTSRTAFEKTLKKHCSW
jgi:PAS domain S-box-containing protein